MGAEVEINRHKRRGCKMQDLKIFLENENVLLRQVWTRLEKVCRPEGIQIYQIKTKSKQSPIKAKPPSELKNAREKVKIILKRERIGKKNTGVERRLVEVLCGMVKEWCQI